jgi:hypothetical protein
MGLFSFLDPIGLLGGGGGGGQGGIGNDSQTTNASQDDHSHTQGNDSIYNTGTLTTTTYSMDGDVALGALDTAKFLGGVSTVAATDLAKMAFDSAQGLAKLSYDENQHARDAGTLAQQNASGLAASMADMVAESKKDPNNATLENVFKYGALAVLALAVAWFFSRQSPRAPATPPRKKTAAKGKK